LRSSLIVIGVYVIVGLGIISFIPNLLDNMEVNAVPLGITGSVWGNPPATLVPGVRVDSAIVHVGNGKMILFGGGNYDYISNYYNDTWSYDVSTNMWKNLQSLSPPHARSQHAMVYDESKGNVILFGGRSNPDRYAETWAYNTSTNKWTNLNPYANPGYQRTIWHAMTSAGNGRVVLFGGEYASNQTWIYNATSNVWFDAKPSSFPNGRSSVAMAFAGLGKVVMFGGGNNPLNVGETWIYDTMINTWMNVTSSYGPNARYSHSMCYDDRSKNVILFGGKIYANHQSILFNDTWLFDTVNRSWKNVTSSYRPPIS